MGLFLLYAGVKLGKAVSKFTAEGCSLGLGLLREFLVNECLEDNHVSVSGNETVVDRQVRR